MAYLLTPPIAWIGLVTVIYLLFRASERLQSGVKRRIAQDTEAYACGEKDMGVDHRPFTGGLNPEYNSFFGSALFFTVTEVAVLLLITLPARGRLPIAAFALLGVIVLCSSGLLSEISNGGKHQ